MKMPHTLAAVLLHGLVSGELKLPRNITATNRHHTDRAPAGSPEAAERIAAAAARRVRRAQKRKRTADVPRSAHETEVKPGA